MKSLNVDQVIPPGKNIRLFRVYKLVSLTLALIFAAVGLIFLFMTNGVLTFFNSIAQQLGMLTAPVEGINFYMILAVAYMYLVTLLAYLMYRHPENKQFLGLLIHGKAASSILSILLFIFHQPYLIYITNAVVDGSLALVLLLFYRQHRQMML